MVLNRLKSMRLQIKINCHIIIIISNEIIRNTCYQIHVHFGKSMVPDIMSMNEVRVDWVRDQQSRLLLLHVLPAAACVASCCTL